MDGCMLRWVKKWLNGQAQRVVVNGVKSSWQLVTTGAVEFGDEEAEGRPYCSLQLPERRL